MCDTLVMIGRNNGKVGRGVLTTRTDTSTCPDTCKGKIEGYCYAQGGWLGIHWRGMRLGKPSVMRWGDFCKHLASETKPGEFFRVQDAGDFPHDGGQIDRAAVGELLPACKGKRGVAYTHHEVLSGKISDAAVLSNRATIQAANKVGLTVNLSGDDLDHADRLAALGIGPVVAVVPEDFPAMGAKTPAGRTCVVCPNQTGRVADCNSCKLCAVPTRKAIVCFRVHGAGKANFSFQKACASQA